MSTLTAVPRVAVTGSLQMLRWPVDRAVDLLGSGDRGTAAELAVERADATLRRIAGLTLRDQQLLDDAARRLEVAENRAHAAELRAKAQATGERADERLDQQATAAERRRRGAAKQAKRRSTRAETARKQTTKRARATAAKRKDANEARTERVEEQLETRERREQLGGLQQTERALDKHDTAATVRDEAQRLREATEAAKADRKS